MSKESKQLASNDLDDQPDNTPVVTTLLIGIGAVFLVIALGLMTGSFKVSLTDGVTMDTDILVPSIMKNIDKFEQVELTETMVKGMVVPIEEGETQEESLRTLLGEHYKELYFMDNLTGSFVSMCKIEDGQTVEDVIERYDACKMVSNKELEGDDYEHVKILTELQPSIRSYVTWLMNTNGELTYLDRIKIKQKYEDAQANKVKTDLIELKNKMKQELTE